MLKFVWCWLFYLQCFGVFFLSYFEVGMSVATTSDRDLLRAEAPWEGPASPQGRWEGCWVLFAGLETREKSGWRAVLLS